MEPVIHAIVVLLMAGQGLSSDPAPRERPGVVLVVEGVGGTNLLHVAWEIGFRRAGLPHEVRLFPWSHGLGRVFDDLQDLPHLLAKAKELAAEVRRLKAVDPDLPIYLVGHSGGTGVVVGAAELLPPDSIERIVLLASALSPQYDLRPALAASRRGVVSYHSAHDFLVLGWGTWQFGTIDRKHVASAGFRGFTLPETLLARDQDLYARLIQVPWRPAMILHGNLGTHNAAIFPRFLAREVARWFR